MPYWYRCDFPGGLVVRTQQDPAAMADEIRKTIWSVDPEVSVPTVRALGEIVADSVANRRFEMDLLCFSPSVHCYSPDWAYMALSATLSSSGSARSAFGWRSARKRRTSTVWCCATVSLRCSSGRSWESEWPLYLRANRKPPVRRKPLQPRRRRSSNLRAAGCRTIDVPAPGSARRGRRANRGP